MKVTISKESKKVLTLDMVETARRIIACCKEDEATPAEYAVFAVNAIGSVLNVGYCVDVLRCSAEIAKNCRVYDRYFEGSADIDVWIDGIAQCSDGFVVFGAYLSDIWEISADNKEEIVSHMYAIPYTAKR